MLTDEFINMCYDEYVVKKPDVPFHQYLEKRLVEHYKPRPSKLKVL